MRAGERRHARGPLLLGALTEATAWALRERGDDLEARPRTGWVAFRSRRLQRVFAELRAHRQDVEAFLLPAPEELGVRNGLARLAPPTQGWGWFRSTFRVRAPAEVEEAVALLLASYRRRWQMSQNRAKESHK